jgi:hypothetical protein
LKCIYNTDLGVILFLDLVNINMTGQNKLLEITGLMEWQIFITLDILKLTISGSVLSKHWDGARTAITIKWHIPHCILGEVSLTASDKASN